MPLSDILRLRQDKPLMTAQQIADQALVADREARRLAREGSRDAAEARAEADAIANQIHRAEG